MRLAKVLGSSREKPEASSAVSKSSCSVHRGGWDGGGGQREAGGIGVGERKRVRGRQPATSQPAARCRLYHLHPPAQALERPAEKNKNRNEDPHPSLTCTRSLTVLSPLSASPRRRSSLMIPLSGLISSVFLLLMYAAMLLSRSAWRGRGGGGAGEDSVRRVGEGHAGGMGPQPHAELLRVERCGWNPSSSHPTPV